MLPVEGVKIQRHARLAPYAVLSVRLCLSKLVQHALALEEAKVVDFSCHDLNSAPLGATVFRLHYKVKKHDREYRDHDAVEDLACAHDVVPHSREMICISFIRSP